MITAAILLYGYKAKSIIENVGDHTVHFGEVVKSETLYEGKAICIMEMPSTYTKNNLVK